VCEGGCSVDVCVGGEKLIMKPKKSQNNRAAAFTCRSGRESVLTAAHIRASKASHSAVTRVWFNGRLKTEGVPVVVRGYPLSTDFSGRSEGEQPQILKLVQKMLLCRKQELQLCVKVLSQRSFLYSPRKTGSGNATYDLKSEFVQS